MLNWMLKRLFPGLFLSLAEATLQETMNQVEQEIGNETQPDTSAGTEELSPEDQELQGLDEDKEFQEAKSELEKEQGGKPLSFAQTKRFRSVYKRMKDAERGNEDLQRKYSELESRQYEEPHYTEADVRRLASNMGLEVTQKQVQEAKAADSFEQLIEAITDPNERKWTSQFVNGFEERLMRKIAERYEPRLAENSKVTSDYLADRSERDAKAYVDRINEENGIQVSYEKDIEPEIVKIIAERRAKGYQINPRNTSLKDLAEVALGRIGIKLGKQLSDKEQRRLAEEKKKAAMETGTPSGATPSDYSQQSLKEIFQGASKEHGM